MAEFAITLLLFVAGVSLNVGILYLVRRWLGSRRPSLVPRPLIGDGNGGWIVPVLATFSGVRGLPWIGFATNNLNPKLTITSTGIAYKVLFRRNKADAEIEQVDVRIFGATVLLRFIFRGSPATFDGNVGSIPVAIEVLTRLGQRIPLGDGARRLIDREAVGRNAADAGGTTPSTVVDTR